MALVPSSFDPEDAFVQLVRVAHSLQSECSDYTYLHPTFTVPSEAPWPVEWAGRDVDVSAFREAYCVGQLRAETVAQLSALRFVWDDDLEALKWKVHLGALFTYKILYGNVAIPPSFHIPVTAAAADPPWSKDIRRSELHLGAIAHALRLNRSTMPELQRDQLDHMGFVWDLADVEWAIRLAALTAFKHIHGHLHVPTTFVVPDGDPAWPAPTFNLPLGWVVVSLRLKKNSLASDRVQLLTKLGFVFKPWRVVHAPPQRRQEPARQRVPLGSRPSPPAPQRIMPNPPPIPLNPIQNPGTGIPRLVVSPHASTGLPSEQRRRPVVTRYCTVDADLHYLGAYASPRFPMFQTRALPTTVEWTDYGEGVRGEVGWSAWPS
ncbi:hypothetical protein H310_06984 [Aphanomyces invadans]|uniref:Helicase-associated domain-containing protein n=1 Tax=Aphanomyces invadans TaxID=157072 RepID=A0A024U7B5_9STRA|nr:hypothetical protein H310_06984 [Aphanomyces invadans]ETW01473.1 hypothetical protein H310_06984 [Aphanomyces invadans]|eukprot:XP_008870471.1 hypothetical protein H310_06984 [Aphanomyces invadans]